jgi:hypothetical protein
MAFGKSPNHAHRRSFSAMQDPQLFLDDKRDVFACSLMTKETFSQKYSAETRGKFS